MIKELLIVRKDLQQNMKTLLVFCGSIAFFPFSMLVVDRYTPRHYNSNFQEALAVYSLSLTVSAFAPLMLGFLLIGVERSKGTMLILWMLPLRRNSLVTAKELSAIVIGSVIFTVNLVSIHTALRLSMGSVPYSPTWSNIANFAAGLFVGAQLCMLLFVLFPQKYAYQVPFFITMLGRPGWLVFHDRFPVFADTLSRTVSLFWIPFCFVLAVLLHYLLVQSFQRIDWTKTGQD